MGKKVILNICILISAIFLILFSLFQKSVEKVNYEDELNEEYRGFVVKKFIDSTDHSICKLVLKSGAIIDIWDNCYKKVEIGDSIVKNKGSLDFLIYKLSGLEVVNIKENLIAPDDLNK
ncbi:hypothetical protein [Flavobacterium sp. 2]|uniref:hypothetical protein n=1 Tax=Flavobacterium sp. 2 TaxID=308053 RepID=UPI003CF605B6